MNKFFLIITDNKYPQEDAGAIRQHTFAKIFSSIGFVPIIIGMGKSSNFCIKKYDSIDYHSLRYSSNQLVFRTLWRLLFTFNLKRIFKTLTSKNIGIILIVSGLEATFLYLKKYTKKHKIPLYFDCVEWYYPCEFKNRIRNLSYKINTKLVTKIIDENYRFFSVSRYLENYFSQKGIRTPIVPILLDMKKNKLLKKTNPNYIKIVYAGCVAKKDHIKEFIDSMHALTKDEIINLKFYIIGTTLEKYQEQFPTISPELLNKNIFFTGRVKHSEVINHLQEADFTVLFRPSNERYAKTGFPSKIVESLSSGTPVICNLSSDLELYLEDNTNSIITLDYSSKSCQEALRRILQLTPLERETLQKNARKTAENFSDIDIYKDAFRSFVANE